MDRQEWEHILERNRICSCPANSGCSPCDDRRQLIEVFQKHNALLRDMEMVFGEGWETLETERNVLEKVRAALAPFEETK